MQRNEYVLKNMFGSFFMASVMSSLMAQLGNITDSIILSHLVSPDTLSVFRVWLPVESIVFLVIGLMSTGASFLSTRGIGAQNYDKVNRVFNHHLYYVFCSTLLVIALVLPFVDELACLATTNERLLPILKPYIRAELLTIFITSVGSVPLSYIVSCGSPRTRTRCVIIAQTLNVVFDLLFVGVFDMGVAGAAYASALANLIAISSLAGYIRKNSYIFRLHRPDKVCSIKMYRECFSIGVPMLISAILAPVLLYVMNTLIIEKLGADGMYIFTVYCQVNAICMLALSASNTAISNIGGILIGEEDYDSLRLLIRRIFRLLTVVMLVVSVLIFLFPDVLAGIYGADGSLLEACRTPFRLMTLTFLPNALSETLGILYFVQGHQKLCRWIEIITNVGAIAIITLIAFYTPELIWYILPVTSWLLLLMLVVMAYVIHRKNPLLSWPTLQNTVPSNPAITFSVPYTIEGAQQFLAKVKPFVKACELNCGITARVAIEELVHEIVATNANRKPDETFDVRIIDKEAIFTVVLKSKGPLRNPIYKYTDNGLMNLDRHDMRRAVMTRMCNDIHHKYMNGINCIYLNYNRNKEKMD